MLSVLTLHHIGNIFLCFFNLYCNGKLDLKFVHGRAEKYVGGNKICPKKVHTSEAETAEENNRTSFRKKVSFRCRHISLSEQFLLQINICCRAVMQNNQMTSSMGQPLLDACSILEKRLSDSRVGYEF